MENGVVDHLWLALRKSKHEIANGEWRLALEKTQYQKKTGFARGFTIDGLKCIIVIVKKGI